MSQVKKEFLQLIEGKDFKYAKTLTLHPHFYTLRNTWDSDEDFSRAVCIIREFGFNQKHSGRTYRYFNLNGYTYWTMGAPVSETILINRAKVVYDASYNQIAEEYDKLFYGDTYFRQDLELLDVINYKITDRVLDVGCGTGLFVDRAKSINPDNYTGIDLSSLMLDVFKKKHVNFSDRLINVDVKDFYLSEYDLILCLYGVASHISCEDINNLKLMLSKNGRLITMHYSQEYTPIAQVKTGVNLGEITSYPTENGKRFYDFIIEIYENL